ncbi:MotA/TolQ/ExbB proton channel family protein [Phaeobacter sp. B1627]|uniref:MotA/TolQ/ExbB proton channel family protein n=1 Tax=Phaeobacter sp. B1627 TaxID=2583809 RepID=UPI00111AC043|nr:MotA/TolQ/ExbB proton channel family protein [Phaeobacter sp. B1627]TNJ42326.1 MotA/TolQ/ExbB proton channel family protein [Phaeobacter sp. B1627]
MGQLIETVGTGGPILVALAVLSLISLTVIIVKWIELWPVLSGAEDRAKAIRMWQQANRKDAIGLVSGQSPADRVLGFAMNGLSDGLRPALLDSEIERRGSAELSAMHHRIRLLEITAMVSPLLGLLGTVLGMIQSFQELELAEGAANASILAGGIWQALLTTAAGLLVAIPAAIAAGLFSARIERAAQSIETAVGQLMLAEEAARETEGAGHARTS